MVSRTVVSPRDARFNRLKLFGFLLFLILLLLFSYSVRKTTPKAPSKFDVWLSSLEDQYRHGEVSKHELPSLALTMSVESQPPRQWKVEGIDHAEQVIRLLELAREGAVFSDDRLLSEDAVATTSIQLRVTGKTGNFSVGLSPREVEGNTQIQLLLKLFQVYGAAPISVADAQEKK